MQKNGILGKDSLRNKAKYVQNVKIPEQEMCKMADKKYIITKYNNKILSCLIENNRLLAAGAQSDCGGQIGNIYVGKVKNVVKSINAAFVEIADGELCFLAIGECRKPFLTNREYDGRILSNDEIVVQIKKEPVKTKEAVLTTNISFSGTYAVVTSEESRIGYSNKLTKIVREKIKEYLSVHLSNHPYGVIIRTNAGELTDYSILVQEIEELSKRCDRLLETAKTRTCFSVLEQAPPAYLTSLRDTYMNSYDGIVTDDADIYAHVKRYMEEHQPEEVSKLSFYEDVRLPLMKLYGIESKLEEALSKRVWLKSGGYLIIEPTEALTVIDVNSGKYSGKKDREETFYLINTEAAEEIARQLKLRNISGIIVIDFINMHSEEHNKALMQHFASLLKKDAVKTELIDMTPLGLVEVTRKKINKTLAEQLI